MMNRHSGLVAMLNGTQKAPSDRLSGGTFGLLPNWSLSAQLETASGLLRARFNGKT